MKMDLESIVRHIIKNISTFNGNQVHTWNDCFQFIAIDQLSIWADIEVKLLIHEMVTIWVAWYYCANFRGVINELHTKYQTKKLDNTIANKILNELININVSNYTDYNDELGYISDNVKNRKINNDEYERFFELSRQTFSIDATYKGSNVPMFKSSRFKPTNNGGYEMCVGDIELI